MKKFGKSLLILTIIFTIFWCFGIYYIIHNQQSIRKQFAVKNNVYSANKTLPEFIGKDLVSGNTINSNSYFAKNKDQKPLLINIWASWCKPCEDEMPLLNKIAQENNKINVLGINIRDNKENAIAFLQRMNIVYPNIDDSSGNISNILSHEVNYYSIPITILVNKEGVIKIILYENLLSIPKLGNILKEYIGYNPLATTSSGKTTS